MTSRDSQTITYDAQNRLVRVADSGAGLDVSYGYSYSDARLYRYNNNTSTVTQLWIGNIYEEKDGKVLCHIYAEGKLIATFEPESTLARIMRKHPYLAAGYQYAGATCYILFGDGRTPTTLMGMGIVVGLYYGLRRRKGRYGPDGSGIFYRNPYRQVTGMAILVAVFIAGAPQICYAGVGEPDYDPVFYYYHSDHLGSSEIMTDREGDLVQSNFYVTSARDRASDKNRRRAGRCLLAPSGGSA